MSRDSDRDIVASLNPGDRVRATLAVDGSTIEGGVRPSAVGGDKLYLGKDVLRLTDGSIGMSYRDIDVISRAADAAPAPPEPPYGSVVVDDMGDAWQRCGGVDGTPSWICTDITERLGRTWGNLLNVYGPVKLMTVAP